MLTKYNSMSTSGTRYGWWCLWWRFSWSWLLPGGHPHPLFTGWTWMAAGAGQTLDWSASTVQTLDTIYKISDNTSCGAESLHHFCDMLSWSLWISVKSSSTPSVLSYYLTFISYLPSVTTIQRSWMVSSVNSSPSWWLELITAVTSMLSRVK